jgi:hypothetical protein
MHSIPIMPWHWEMGYSGLLQVDINKGNQPQFFIDVRWFWTKLCNLTYDVIFPVAIFFLKIIILIFFLTQEQTHLRGYWWNFGRWPAFWGSSSRLALEINVTWLLPVEPPKWA